MKIIELDKNTYKGYSVDYLYVTKFYYDVIIKSKNTIDIRIKRKRLRKKTEKKFTDSLFQDYIEQSEVFGIFEKKKLIAIVEGSIESWNNRYRIWNFLVDVRYRKMGYGKALFQHIENHAKSKNARALVLETQSCNDPAIQFYQKQGMHFIGLDSINYTNNDIDNKEVRLEFGKRL